jgi:hypothetical protein
MRMCRLTGRSTRQMLLASEFTEAGLVASWSLRSAHFQSPPPPPRQVIAQLLGALGEALPLNAEPVPLVAFLCLQP